MYIRPRKVSNASRWIFYVLIYRSHLGLSTPNSGTIINMNNKALIALVIMALVGVGVYFLITNLTAPARNIPEDTENPARPSEGPITERGTITCIPKIGTGPQTMECALGLRNSKSVYYGLRYLSDHDENFALVSPEINVEVTGTLVHEETFGPDGNRYDTVGIIEINSISEI